MVGSFYIPTQQYMKVLVGQHLCQYLVLLVFLILALLVVILLLFSCIQFYCHPMDSWTPLGSSGHGFPRQEHWSGLSFPSPGDLPNPGIELVSPALVHGFFTNEPLGDPLLWSRFSYVTYFIFISILYISIPISQFIPPPVSPLGNHKFVLCICNSISALQTSSSVPFF